MFDALSSILKPDTLFQPVGIPLGDAAFDFIIFFGVVLGIGVILRAVLAFRKNMNPYLQRLLQKIAFVFMFWGVVEILYFLIREQKTRYMSANIMFVLITVIFLIWVLYLVLYRYLVVYRREKQVYDYNKKQSQYIPKKKK